MTDYEIFELGDIVLQCKTTLRNAKLAYKTYGTLSAKRDNVIVYPTWYSGQHYENEWLIGSGMALDPSKYFVIIPNMFGNGLSSSPSNTPAPWNGPKFPNVTAFDNVRQQHRLVTEKFGIEKVKLVTGWSMGALQTYHWGAGRSIPTWSSAFSRSKDRRSALGIILSSSKAPRRRSWRTPPSIMAGTTNRPT